MASMLFPRAFKADRPRSIGQDSPGDPTLAASGATSLAVELLDPDAAAAHLDAWNDLLDRCLEDNVFLDPAFCLTAASHLAPRERPCFILVWDGDPPAQRSLIAVCPIVFPRNPLRRLATCWVHDLTAVGVPLLDRDRARAGLEAMLACMADRLRGRGGMLFESMPADGPTAALLRHVAATTGRGFAVISHWHRAVLHPRGAPDRAGLGALSSKAGKEIRRQTRRLADLGRLGYASLRDGDLEDATEQFLALEAGGWKGRAGTALLRVTSRAVFARTMIRLLGRQGRCRIDRLALDGAPIAMAVVLSCGRSDYLWKIAYAEELARFSPGVQLVLALSERQEGDGRILATDSCAVPGHPMIDRLWRDRLAMQDVAVALAPDRNRAFRSAVAGERLWRRLRASAKAILHRWRRSRH